MGVLAHREDRSWRLVRIRQPDSSTGSTGDDVVLGHVRRLDEIQALTGTTLVETGGHGAALAPDTLPPDLHTEVAAARRENDTLTAALDQARRRWRHLAASLRREGLTTTQTAKALGISRAAVDKLVTRATAETPTNPDHPHNSPDTGPHTSPTDPTALADGSQVQEPPGGAQDAQAPQDPRGPQMVAVRVQAARRDVEQATARQEAFAPRWRRLAVALQDAGLTSYDVAHLMGITQPRVSQLAPYDGTRTVPVRPAPESVPAAHAQTPTKTPARALAAKHEERTDNLDRVTARLRG